LSLVENIQRSELNPIEEAEGYQSLLSNYNYTQEDISKAVGKSRSYIGNIAPPGYPKITFTPWIFRESISASAPVIHTGLSFFELPFEKDLEVRVTKEIQYLI